MTRAATLCVIGSLGLLAGLEATDSRADEQPPYGQPVTRYVTVTVQASYDGLTAREWAHRARVNKRGELRQHRDSQARGQTIQRLRHSIIARWAPTLRSAVRLASAVTGVPERDLLTVAYCESTWNPFAVNGRYKGYWQLGWDPFGLSPFDPYAAALSTAMTVVHDGGWRQWQCKPR